MMRRPRTIFPGGMLLTIVCLAGPAALGQSISTTPKPADGPAAFRFAPVDETALGLWEGDRPILVYNHGVRSKKGNPPPQSHRSYIHPLYGLDGEVLTDDFPTDHLHHRGIFWAWPHVTVDGKERDLWIQSGIDDRFDHWTRQKTEQEQALLGVENLWYADGRPVMREQLLVRVHRILDQGRAIDLDLTWTPIDKPITLVGAEGKSYGGLTFRYAPGAETQITVPSGLTKDDLYMTNLPWADFTRLWPGRATPSGASVFVHPSHPDFPPTWLTRHYGALCVGWPGVRSKMLDAGKPVECRYRIWVHRGRPNSKTIAQAFSTFAAESGREGARRPAPLSKP
jgi:Family of unknown function (DUF6807)